MGVGKGRHPENQKHQKTDRTGQDRRGKAESEGNLGSAAELRYGKLLEFQALESESVKLVKDYNPSSKMLKEEVKMRKHVAEVVSKWSGVPVTRMLEGEIQKLLIWKSACVCAS